MHYKLAWGMITFGAGFGFSKALYLLVKDYNLRKAKAKSEEPTTDYGSAREAYDEEVIAQGMHDPASGNLLGHNGSFPVFAPAKTPFSLIEMPPGVGKTSCYVMGSILHKAMQGYSVFVSDVKPELAPMLAEKLRAYGFEVQCINPTKAYEALCRDVEVNPFQMVLDAVYATGEQRLDAATHASDYAKLILPPNPNEKQPYFSNGSRRTLNIAILSESLMSPATCTPTGIYNLLVDPEKFIYRLKEIQQFLDTGIENDPLVYFLKSESANLLHRTENNEENFGSFLEGATQKLLPFNPSGRLANYGSTAIANLSDTRKRQVITFVMAPMSHIKDFEALLSLINHNVIAACKADPLGHPIHIVAEEALNYRFADLSSNLEVMRGLKMTADFYIQSFSGLVRLYGKDEAAAIESYMDIKIYAGLTSYDRAKFVSDMLSDTTIKKQDYSFQATEIEEIGLSSKEISRRLKQPNEILNMPRGKAWVFVRGMNPMCLDMVHVSKVIPWRNMIGDHPIEGPLSKSKALFKLDYPKKKGWWRS